LTAHWHGLPPLFWLSSYVTSHHLVVVPQSGAKDKFYCTVYYITSNSYCEAQSVSENLKKLQKIELEAKINAWLI
jgi:hypothetical protein